MGVKGAWTNSARSQNTQNGQETAWVGAECQIMLGKIVGSEKKVVVSKLIQKVEVFGQWNCSISLMFRGQ